jgi:hypothetical protein
MPRMLQETLCFDTTEQEREAHSEGESCEVVSRRGSNRSGAGLVEGSSLALISLTVPSCLPKPPRFAPPSCISSTFHVVSNVSRTGFVAQTERTWTPEWRHLWEEQVRQKQGKGRQALVAGSDQLAQEIARLPTLDLLSLREMVGAFRCRAVASARPSIDG